MMQTVIFSLLLLLQATPMPRFLQVVLMDAGNRPIADQPLQLEIQTPFVQMQCVTDASGICEFNFVSTEQIVRGRLVIMGRGVRPVIWRGNSLTLPLTLDENNALSIPTDFVNKQNFVVSTAIATTSAEAATVTTSQPTSIQSALLATPTATSIPLATTQLNPTASSSTIENDTDVQTVASSERKELGRWEISSLLLAGVVGLFLFCLIYVLLEGPQ